ncbi:hypothetical protein E5843_00115 [Luteimonas yindakuii]|uniref:hypothetical protein n=1 Tax=Luteimonas yindakuii TaxID=2565782 RepID=UPI0011078C0A|nr:hypothetical protein [Luteimonas yindakuii]QCO66599.2 hypothetical protein E5843_00115 [Luteimonas yindakuii]
MPWGAWLYLLLLAAVGVLHLVIELRARAGMGRALLRFAAVGVIGAGVVLFYRGAGAGVPYMLLLFVAALLVSRKSVEDAQAARAATADGAIAPPRWLGLTRLVVLPGIAWGALAVWVQQHA